MGEIKEECTSPDKRKVALYSSGESKATASACETASSLGSISPEVSHLRWGMWYKLWELKVATNGLCEENVNGEGGYGSVYRGLFPNGTKVAGDLDLICPKVFFIIGVDVWFPCFAISRSEYSWRYYVVLFPCFVFLFCWRPLFISLMDRLKELGF